MKNKKALLRALQIENEETISIYNEAVKDLRCCYCGQAFPPLETLQLELEAVQSKHRAPAHKRCFYIHEADDEWKARHPEMKGTKS